MKTIEQKAKAYDEILEMARKELQACDSTECDEARQIFRFFPELKESEDERVIKALKEGFKYHQLFNPTFGGIPCVEIVNWLEKQGNHKLTDKAEPKFHKGDWIISDTINQDYHICKITDIKDGNYTVESIYGYKGHNQFDAFDNAYRLWTIQDAKPGDILELDCGIGIFKDNCIGGYNIHCYCYYSYEDVLEINKNSLYDNYQSHPATKEQRERFFAAIHDAGYEWDAEKKELKKFEDEEYNEEDYGIDSLFHAQRILEKTLGKVDGYQSDDGILEHKCAISAVKKLYEQKPAWNKEDKEKELKISSD